MNTHSSDILDNEIFAQQALLLMQKHKIAPVPENFAIWFHYAVGKNQGLMQEVDNLVKKSLPFNEHSASYLHNKFILPSPHQKTVDDAAATGQKVLVEVLKVINEFSDETKSYDKNVDQYLDNISQKFDDNNVKAVVKELVSATVNLRQRSEKIRQKLEDSTAEISNLKKDLDQVTTEAQRDFLTGAYNRKAFEKYADEQIALAKQSHMDMCLMMIDVDHFKRFNDRFGHLLGDEVLKIVAKTLINVLKGRDIVARFGGEEFVVLLPETPMEGAMKIAEIIRSTIADKELKRKDTGETFGSITVSIGVSYFKAHTDELPTLIKRADDALYESKNKGRNRVTSEIFTGM